MTDEPYLICHKVRGASAFDIAIRMEVNGEFWWIIPTSGHRAHPLWWISLERTMIPSGLWKGEAEVMISITDMEKRFLPTAFDDLEDHYTSPNLPETHESKTAGRGLLASLGLRTASTITRRV